MCVLFVGFVFLKFHIKAISRQLRSVEWSKSNNLVEVNCWLLVYLKANFPKRYSIMDLVDIDQVLDNFELYEEARNEQSRRTEEKLSKKTELKNSSSNTNNGHVQQYVENPTDDDVSLNPVSQVDYRNRVDTLESKSSTTTVSEICKNSQEEYMSGHRFKAHHLDSSTKLELADYENELEGSKDIHKFTEETRNKLKPNNDMTEKDVTDSNNSMSSESLTTSSNSTFSSGPTFDVESSMEDPSPATENKVVDSYTSNVHLCNESEIENSETKVKTHNYDEKVLEVQQWKEYVSVQEKNVTEEDNKSKNIEDLAQGLSSISIASDNFQSQSILPLEASLSSSSLGKVLDNFTDSEDTSAFSQIRDVSDKIITSETKLTSIVSEPLNTSKEVINECVQQKKYTTPQPKLHHLPNESNLQQVFEHTQVHKEAPVQLQQPITFCSTMDDISDTELDSMLQEMDIDEESADEQPKSKSDFIPIESPEIAENLNAKMSKIDETSACISMEHKEDILTSTSSDHPNCDSFSQASTVEFSEVRPQIENDCVAVPEIDVATKSVVSSYSNSESSSLEEDIIRPKAYEELEDDIDASKPQRPTSLDLPALQLQGVDLYANAGQTPPGNDQQLQNPHSHQEMGQSEHKTLLAEEEEEDKNNHIPNEVAEATGYSEDPNANLGKVPPIWVPDNMAAGCMNCSAKFTMIKRRHHCRACGKVLCSVCCSEKYKLEFLTEPESRICVRCYLILTQREELFVDESKEKNLKTADVTENLNAITSDTNSSSRSPNPNNPMEYCSTIPPHRQVSLEPKTPPSVIVPVGVLKKDNGSYSSNSSNSSGQKARKRKSVMFSDGIAPGSDLASIDQWNEPKQPRRQNDRPNRNSTGNKPPTPARSEQITDATTMGLVAQLFRGSIPPAAAAATVNAVQSSPSTNSSKGTVSKPSSAALTTNNNNNTKFQENSRAKRLPPSGCDDNGCFIPENRTNLPPIVITKDESGCDFEYKDVTNNFDLVKRLQNETLKFAVQKNFFVFVKILNLNCCLNRTVINFTTYGMHHVGNDEIIILLEYEAPTSKDDINKSESPIPIDIFVHLNEIYNNAESGNPIQDLSHTSPQQTSFLGSRDYGGFIFIRPTFQCMQDIILPDNPFLIGILIHRYEVPWAKVFPLRLMLRLGAQYRYYPCPHISMVKRDSVYAKIAQTIINFLADFRNYSYTLPFIRGMYIHMEDRQTTVVIPRNRLEDVIKAINNSSDHILAFGGNFSKSADGHLVCMQNVNDDRSEMYAYSTQAINIQGQPRKITGASFFVLNESLKTTSGLSGKCSIVEDGLMVQILPSKMEEVRNSLKNQTDVTIICGPVDADEQHTEIVCLKWVDNDKEFNIGVKSPIDDRLMDGISSMRVHASFNYSNSNYSIRLTDIYVIKHDNWYNTNSSTISVATTSDITRMTEQIARSTSAALVSFLDLLAASKSTKIGLRATLHQDNVCYEAGTRGSKFPPLYMNALDNHLIPTLHSISSSIEEAIILELIFYILNV